MSLRSYIVGQFKQPHGVMGKLAGAIMAHRPSNIARNHWTVDLLRLEEDHQVLEIGCGPGLALKKCTSNITSGRAVGIDHSKIMVDQARARLSGEIAARKVELRVGNLELLAEYPRTFDRVFSLNVVQFFPDLETAFRQMHDSLKVGGMVVTTYQPRHPQATGDDALQMAERIEANMNKAGFNQMVCHELPLKPVPVISVIGRREN
jgi:cyclopropane fatty-acyl-phospholipid synthase-like methyltransferase